jgi:hypothetical protein
MKKQGNMAPPELSSIVMNSNDSEVDVISKNFKK